MNIALEMSKKQYMNDNNLYNDEFIEEQIKEAIKLSIEEDIDKQEKIAKEESLKIENERIKNLEINNRKKSLEEFSKRIKTLNLSVNENEKEIKNFIENTLDDYFNLKIDYINIEKDLYEKIYKIIDSYYLIPFTKKYKKTAISHEEDQILRNIFLHKNI